MTGRGQPAARGRAGGGAAGRGQPARGGAAGRGQPARSGAAGPGQPETPALVCPGCGCEFSGGDRFCPRCQLPLALVDDSPGELTTVSARHERARKIKPQLAEGRLVRVAGARNQAEAEFIQGLLLEEGVPSLLRRSAGFDVPDFLAAGPRDILVPLSGLDTAREVLLEAEVIRAEPSRPIVSPVRLLVGLMVALVLGALVVWLISLAVR